MTTRRAFALLSMMLILMLLGVFALIAGRLFVSTIRVTASAQDIHTQTTRLDGLIRLLRADAWSASGIDLQADSLVFRGGRQAPVTWRIAPDHTVIRTPQAPGDPERRWPGLGVDLSFEVRQCGLVLKIHDGPMKSSNEMIMPSQLRLLGRTSP